MRNSLRLVLAAVFSLSLVGIAAMSAAQPAGDVPAHRHYVQIGTEMVPVGPQVCDDPRVQNGFNQFHAHVHVGTAGGFAMDHEHNQTNIVSGAC